MRIKGILVAVLVSTALAAVARASDNIATVASYQPPKLVAEVNTSIATIESRLDTVEAGGVAGGTDAFTVTASGTATATFIGADAAGAANTEYDTTGAGAITVGSADVTAITLTTDGTGTAEVVLPNDSVGDAEIDFASVTGADLTLTDCAAITASGTVTANGNTALGNATNDSTTIAGMIVILSGIPTSTNGLTAGCLYNDSGAVKIF